MKFARVRHVLTSSALLLVTSFAVGCSASADDDVHPNVDVEWLGKSVSGLSSAAITAINGTYSESCDSRSAGQTWSAGANGNASLDHAALSVRKNDDDCVLTLTHVKVGAASYAASATIALGTSFAESPSAFKDVAEDPVDFYGNAKISSTSFASDFTITLKVSADHNDDLSSSKQGDFATQTSTVSTDEVAAPTYNATMSGFVLMTDAKNVVSSTDGFAQLNPGAVAGQDYAVYDGALTGSDAPETVAAAFDSATYSGFLAELPSLRIPDEQFNLVGEDLSSAPAVRTIIIRNTDGETQIVSYQLIMVSFSKPSS